MKTLTSCIIIGVCSGVICNLFSIGIHPFYSFIASSAVVLSGSVMFGFVWSNEG